MSRNFKIEKAVRRSVPLLIGLMGPSGGGKTYSALRLAKGIQKVFPGDIIHIDTESNRALHYASIFDFQHVPFGEPFGSMDYLEVLNFAQSKKPSIIIIDSMSHEHESIGGMLDLHEKELDRMAGNDHGKRQRMGMLAWHRPKSDRRKLINGLLQMNSNFIFCFRAKESSRPSKDKNGKSIIENFGFMPIAGNEFVFEMTINMLLLPHANGIPTWKSDNKGESMMMKLPEQFKSIFNKPGIQLDEAIGEKLATWAKGNKEAPAKKQPVNIPELKTLEWYLLSGKVKDKTIKMGGKEENLLEKTRGAIKYLKGLNEFTPDVKGFSDVYTLIEMIENPEPDKQTTPRADKPDDFTLENKQPVSTAKPEPEPVDDGLEIF